MQMATNPDRLKLDQLRALLPATAAGIYLDTASLGPMPAETAAAMREADDWELRVGRTWDGRDEDVAQRAEEARAVIAALIGADPSHITLTHGRRDALELAQQLVGGSGRRVIDATYLCGVQPIDVEALDADAIAFGCDRWLLGPEGTGALWVASNGGTSPRRELPRTTLIGVARSVGWLEMFVGLDWIYDRTSALADRLFSALSNVPGIELVTPRDGPAAIVSFRLASWTAAEAADELSRRVQALVRPMSDLDAIRASIGWFNTEDELDRFADAVAELASHTPQTLPRRPSLVVLTDS
jgi:selenocysteine lyase/cysteine desulfurase